MDAKAFDEQVVRLEKIDDLARDFVLVRLERITGVDLNVFKFDYDLTFQAFFVEADGKILGRFGGREPDNAERYLTLPALRHAMQAALEAHRRAKPEKPADPPNKLLVEEYPAAKRLKDRGCIHCHQVNEFHRAQEKDAGRWQRDDRWVYPLPRNIGLTLDPDRGDRVKAVAADSPAGRAGVQPGDILKTLNGLPVASFGDVQYALHRSPVRGEIAAAWQRGDRALTGNLTLADGWRRTNLTWRPSMLDILPSLPLSGDDLSAAEKKALGIADKNLAFRQGDRVHTEAKAAGVQAGDVVVGIDGRTPELTMDEFFGHVRRNYLVGDRITLNVLRAGKRLDLPMTLR
jgi:hypothetical protein